MSEDFASSPMQKTMEEEIAEAQRDEARAKADKAKAEADKAREEVNHERAKAEKTRAEAKKTGSVDWHEIGRTAASVGALALSIAVFVRDGKIKGKGK